MLNQYEGVLPNIHLDACTREQLQAAHPGRFFPCPDVPNSTAHSNWPQHQDTNTSHAATTSLSDPAATATKTGVHAHDASASSHDPEAIAGLQQGTAAWHKARSSHITGSQLADLLGFSCPAANRVLCKHQVYHRVTGTYAGHSKLLHCIGSLRRDKHSSTAAAAAPVMELFGQLACEWGTQHEAAAHHTLLQHSPPGSLLIDTGFVTPAFDAEAAFYSSILAASPATSVIGSLGDIPLHAVRDLRLGCSLDGLLLTPRSSAVTNTDMAHNSSFGSSGGSSFGNGRQPHNIQRTGSSAHHVALDASSIRRAPPYSWARQAGYDVSCVEIKCPTPFWAVKDKPWGFACVGQDRNRPYQRMRAGHYCQSQLSMLVTGLGSTAAFTSYSSCSTRFVTPDSFTPPPTSLFWDPTQLQDNDTQLSDLYRRFIEATAVLAAGISSKELPDPIYKLPWSARSAQQQQQQQHQQNDQQELAQQQGSAAGVAQGIGHLKLQTDAAGGAAGTESAAAAAAAAPPVSRPPPGWQVNSSGRPAAHWVLLEHPAFSAASDPADPGSGAVTGTPAESCETQAAAAAAAGGGTAADVAAAAAGGTAAAAGGTAADGAAAGLDVGASSGSSSHTGSAGGLGWTGVYSCMVKSLVLPARLQQPLQQDRWFLDRLDPDSTWQQQQLRLQQAWLTHPLIENLCHHPQGVLVLLQRLHMSQPSLHMWAAAAAAGGTNAAAVSAGSGGSSAAAGAVAMRGLSPGKCVLALLFKTEQLNCLDLSPIWRLLPHAALEVLQLWRTAAQRRATAAAPSAVAAGTAWPAQQTATASGTAAQASLAETASAVYRDVQTASNFMGHHVADSADVPKPPGAGTETQPKQHPNSRSNSDDSSSSKAGSSTEASQGALPAVPWVAALQSWRQRQQLRQQQLVAALRRCISGATHQRLRFARFAPRQVQHSGIGCTQARQQQQQQAGVRKHTGRPVSAGLRRVRSGSSNSSGGSGSSKLAGSLRQLGLADLLQDHAGSDVAAAAATAAAAAAAAAAELPIKPPRGLIPFGVPVAAAAACVSGPSVGVSPADSCDRLSPQPNPSVEQQQPQQVRQDSASSLPAVPATAAAAVRARQFARIQRGSLSRRQQQARKLVSAAQQQQRAARAARYQEAVKTWSLVDIVDEVRHVQVVQQPLHQPVHEMLQGILATQEQASELQQQAAAQEQQRRRKAPAGRLQPAKRQPVVAAAAADTVLTPTQQQTGVQEQQGQGQQQQKCKQQQGMQMQQNEQLHAATTKQKPQRKPRQAKAASLRPPAAASQLHTLSQQLQQSDVRTQLGGVCSEAGAIVIRHATGSDVATAAVAAAGAVGSRSEACKLAAITVVAPAAVLACTSAQQD